MRLVRINSEGSKVIDSESDPDGTLAAELLGGPGRYGRTSVTITWRDGPTLAFKPAPQRKLVKTVQHYDDGTTEEVEA